MANEIALRIALTLTRSQTELVNYDSGALSLNQLGSRAVRQVQSVLTTAAAVSLGTIGTVGYVLVRNMDTLTNQAMYLLTTSAGARFQQLSAGEVCLLKLGPDVQAPYVSMQSTAAQAEVIAIEL